MVVKVVNDCKMAFQQTLRYVKRIELLGFYFCQLDELHLRFETTTIKFQKLYQN